MEGVKIYTKERCQPCKMTKREFARIAIQFTEIPLETVPDLVEQFVKEGLTSAPIVDTGEDRWAGFQPNKIKKLGESRNAG